MNAFAMREIDAHELAERRRAYIASQIRDCLYGKTLYVNIAWNLDQQPVVVRQNWLGLIDVMEDELLKAFENEAPSPLLSALEDAHLREKLLERREHIIETWANTTHDCMTAQELEALPC